MRPVINGIQGINHAKITNYIDIVHQYIDRDFIMHFRLSRTVAYDLIYKFEHSRFFNILLHKYSTNDTP